MDKDLEEYMLKITEVKLISTGHRIETKSDLTICPNCRRERKDIANRRLNTLYTNEPDNWLESCLDCYGERIDYYNERWDEYRSSQGYW